MNAPASANVGLSSAEAAVRLRRDGPNALPAPRRRSLLRIALRVVAEPMVLFLVLASAVYFALGDAGEATLLAGSVIVVIGMTLYQEQRAEHALQALRQLGSPRAHVVRDGVPAVIAACEVVVGDVIVLDEGDRVPADATLIEGVALQADESLLTGESAPVDKEPGGATVHAHTLVVRGHGRAVVTTIGTDTAVGRIGASLRELHPEPTPLQREMRGVVLLFALLGLASCIVMTVAYGITRDDWPAAVLAGITLAIANIPEEFPVVLTVFLAAGAWRLAQHRALVRRSAAIETLGAVTVLCTDKTGTLTRNRMAVATLVPGLTADANGAKDALLRLAALACPVVSHDPMDLALKDATAHVDNAVLPHVHEYPLNRALPVTGHVWALGDDQRLLACKGAPEAVARICSLSERERQTALATAASLAARGLRVLAVASSRLDSSAPDALPASLGASRLQWEGLVAFADPLRDGVPEAVADARAAGIRVIMLTGDHAETARAIACEAGLDVSRTCAGSELDDAGTDGLARIAERTQVFARVRPEQKLRLVQSLKQRGEIVGMTGDGVNDAPALMAADVGIAMGERGTDVAREAAAIVLLDDDFVTIVRTIRMGRTIYDNIRRAMRYILAVHVPITGLALLPLFMGGPLLLLPLHVVFLELIIDPACAFVFEREPPEENVMRRPPRGLAAKLLSLREMLHSLSTGLAMLGVIASVHVLTARQDLAEDQVRALTFSALVAGNLSLIALYRTGNTLWETLRSRNPAFWAVAASSLMLLMLVTFLPALAPYFRFAPPPWPLWLMALGLPAVVAAWLHLVQPEHAPGAQTRSFEPG
ncbi:cation-translocating P-type ATPase [Lysobacter soli]|uniref:cation-translocating P-type ATPase n=1 Tax=Lysobacter soli TaxID=453783 RepID=UPI0037CB3708